MSSKFFLEIVYIGGPYAVFYYLDNRSAMIYCIFKIFRYFRLFEIDGQIEESLEHQANSKTVFEIKKIERNMQILQFSLKTIINLHILTCSIVVLWTHYGEEMENDEFYSVYIKAIYFVTTTLTTCGFGDISAK